MRLVELLFQHSFQGFKLLCQILSILNFFTDRKITFTVKLMRKESIHFLYNHMIVCILLREQKDGLI